MSRVKKYLALVLGSLFVSYAPTVPAMLIVLNPDVGLLANPTALGSFQQAAATWSSRFSDPFTVTINAGLGAFGPTMVQTTPTLLQGSYTTIRNSMVADAANEPSNNIVASMPTAAQFAAQVPAGNTLSGNVTLTQANANALGFNINFGVDGTINFNSGFAFDYDNSNGVGAGLVDFETAALREIGRVLGFISVVDSFSTPGAHNFSTLDMFRFAVAQTPTTAAQFTNNPRNFVPGAAVVFSDSVTSWALSTGINGDGQGAGNWKDDALTGILLGVMDPTLSTGTTVDPSVADLRAFDLLGYELVRSAVPEPATLALVGFAIAGLGFARRRRLS